jgi:hypothetical protein
MHVFEVKEAKSWHVGQMARTLRSDLIGYIENYNMNVHREMSKVFNESYYRKIWVVDGKLCGIGGISGSAVSCAGFIWVALNSNALKFPKEIVKESQRQVALALEFHSKLLATTFYGDVRARRFIEFLGFSEFDHNELWTYFEFDGGER